jgi:DNA gyrase/topoisomerase IV subunit A
MADQSTLNRRRVLELSGVGSTLAVAGCLSQLNGSDSLSGDRGELAEDERRVTMAVRVDQQALQQKQLQLQQEIQSGNKTQEEARTELEELQAQLVDEAFQTVLDEFEPLDLTIENTVDRGLMLVAGPATDLIDATDTDVVEALAGGDLFEQAQQAAQQQQPATPPENTTDS